MDEYEEPVVSYEDDKKDPNNYVKVCLTIKGLKKTLLGDTASNAEIVLDRTERSICVTVAPKGKSKISKYKYEVKRLPKEISTDDKKTYFKVEKDDQVVLRLHKAEPGSWDVYLSSNGLEYDGVDT